MATLIIENVCVRARMCRNECEQQTKSHPIKMCLFMVKKIDFWLLVRESMNKV